ncbi:glycosyltransferase [Aliivibrio fischeri]|uniref:glycosyltransferase n=1 Tax=Aliivibrio fischeri TaxID=668 RepID=UPI0012D9207B|nr:glycosyltransferase [Aliivibrio fischeri]MUK29470.1 glycosyltransferase [Aliivibrio fischeri]
MKYLIISNSDLSGGAARASYRLFTALRKSNNDSAMLVTHKISDNTYVYGSTSFIGKGLTSLKVRFSHLLQSMQKTENQVIHSGSWLPSSMPNEINTLKPDVINLHWINGETLSVKQIGKLKQPVVMTLHDMWAFCGTEHYTDDAENARFRNGYTKNNRSQTHQGVDLDRLVWEMKRKHWKKTFTIITPSHWLSECARNSKIFSGFPIHTVPNVLDTDVYKPLDKAYCREVLGLPLDVKLIGFGAMGGGQDPRKGFDLLIDSLKHLSNNAEFGNIECVVFGQSEPENKPCLGMPIRFLGHFHDDISLAIFYNAIDVMVVPSRQENLPQTATEAQACGIPVVAFNATGLVDVIEHKITGYLADAYYPIDMARGIEWVLSDSNNYKVLSRNARNRAVRLWSPDVVIPQYLKVYEEAFKRN